MQNKKEVTKQVFVFIDFLIFVGGGVLDIIYSGAKVMIIC
nr:MAG TPA_asm: hypothetical protein [Caudoviricetes sp.]